MRFLVNIIYFLLMIIYKITKKLGCDLCVLKYNDEYVFIYEHNESMDSDIHPQGYCAQMDENINKNDENLAFDISEPIIGDLTKEALDKFIEKVNLKEKFVCTKCKTIYDNQKLIINGWGCKKCTDL